MIWLRMVNGNIILPADTFMFIRSKKQPKKNHKQEMGLFQNVKWYSLEC